MSATVELWVGGWNRTSTSSDGGAPGVQHFINYQGCRKFLVPLPQPLREEYQVVKKERGYHGCGEDYNVKKVRGSNIIFPGIFIMAVGKDIKWGKREGSGTFWEENKGFEKERSGEEYQAVRNFTYIQGADFISARLNY